MYHYKFFTESEINYLLESLHQHDFNQESDQSKPDDIVQTLGAATTATAIYTTEVVQVLELRSLCHEWATKVEEGLWPLMTPEQKKLALLYFDTEYWQHKLALFSWAPIGIPAVALAPKLLDRLANDFSAVKDWFRLTLPFTNQRALMQDSWEFYHGMQTERFDSKVVRLLSTLGCMALGVVSIAFGDVLGSAALANIAHIFSSVGLGTSVFGLLAAGTYSGIFGQESSKQGFRLWNKLASGLPFNVIKELTEEQEQAICEQLSISYTSWSWWNKLRIRLATGDSYLPGKAWVKQGYSLSEDKSLIYINGEQYRIDKKVNSYVDVISLLSAGVGATIGFYIFGPLGAIVGGILGYYLGNKIGALISFHQKPLANAHDFIIGKMNKVLYEQCEHVKYKILKQNIFTHIYKSYYRNAYENTDSIILSVILGTIALLLDIIKTIVLWPYHIIQNAYDYFSPGQLFSKLQFTFDSLAKEYENLDSVKGKILFVGKCFLSLLFSFVIFALKLPKIILGAALSILNPFQQTDYMRQQTELLSQKSWLKQEMNAHGLINAQSPEQGNMDDLFVKRYRQHTIKKYESKVAELKREKIDDENVEETFEEKCSQTWNSMMSFFKVNPSGTRRGDKIRKWNVELEEIGCNHAFVP